MHFTGRRGLTWFTLVLLLLLLPAAAHGAYARLYIGNQDYGSIAVLLPGYRGRDPDLAPQVKVLIYFFFVRCFRRYFPVDGSFVFSCYYF